jgi:hypothetical protein
METSDIFLAQEVENASAISVAGIGASSEYPVLISSTQRRLMKLHSLLFPISSKAIV